MYACCVHVSMRVYIYIHTQTVCVYIYIYSDSLIHVRAEVCVYIVIYKYAHIHVYDVYTAKYLASEPCYSKVWDIEFSVWHVCGSKLQRMTTIDK